MPRRYNASRGGYAPGHSREAFWEYVDAGDKPLEGWVIGQLCNCTDTLPGDYCVEMDLPRGSTYAQAVRRLAMIAHSTAD